MEVMAYKYMIKIIPPHKKASRLVRDYSQIEIMAKELKSFSDGGPFLGNYKNCYALHHSQVSNEPYNFFTLSESGKKALGDKWLIINPEIVSKIGVKVTKIEGCMSYPFRGSVGVLRFPSVRVRYQTLVKGFLGKEKLLDVEETLSGLAAQIFQHETDHGKGVSVYTK